MDMQAEQFVETFVKELEEENVAIFAGAGLSSLAFAGAALASSGLAASAAGSSCRLGAAVFVASR